ncbi:MAG TPA: HlyD family efflux transporter periplasmic adaptor subunit [Beijerinckiaceae bacterium]|nr:HlyD family efflux transporter periplasmic adaptor subunit [Beijerinckiaceae bacterium]
MLESLCALALAAKILPFCAPPPQRFAGYVEGEYVHLGPIEVAQIRSITVRRGERVAPGQAVAVVETSDAELAVADAAARLAQVEAELANLRRGRRPEEIAVIEASLASAEAQAREAKRALERRQDLFRRGFSPQAELDQAQTTLEVSDGKVRELKANLDVARLPARPNEILAFENRVAQARAAHGTAQWRLGQRTIRPLAAGRVTDIIRRTGEVAGPTTPVLAMLPDGAVKLKVYVPQRVLSAITVGGTMIVRCDGCGTGMKATVSYVAPEPEFTPPVIYSVETRQKLVYLVEARPEGAAMRLQPGQIVDVTLDGSAP